MTLSADFAAELRAALGDENVVTEPEQLRVYECDGLTGHRAVPELVALPAATEEVQAVVRACHRAGLPFVARGAGTGLSGGATPVAGGVVISLARMDRILEIDLASQRIVVEPGVANLDVTRAVAADGFFYAPDPSSQQVCTIGGNVAENSGGAHCLKHGFTVHHVTGLTVVLPDGDVVELGGKALDPDGPDLLGLVGDTADGIPGLEGWGKSSAAKVLTVYKHIQHIPDDAAKWTVAGLRGADRLATSLRTSRELAMLYQKLATLRIDCPIVCDLDALAWRGPNRPALETLCAEIGLSPESVRTS